ncbi:MAG: N-acetyltransferase [Candidatus Fermentimicrarchaeum limneticum]|uniref:N-acetyltransferase n=1 Tax=Fermentimicrarchaeum limneticum TaxID=2795018 RepID=A0A7D6BMB2_FERL1|nr:MAG: N-acetyltransferase [Candidatus Fermentimicrarchaeum limneticum]
MHTEKPAVIDVTVGKAKPEEMPSVVQLYKKRGVETSGVGPANTHVARTESGRVVGALSVVNCGGVPVIKNIAVDMELEGRGVGRQLFEYVIEELKKQGHHHIIIAHQNRNQGFYSKFGFKELNPSEMVLELRG